MPDDIVVAIVPNGSLTSGTGRGGFAIAFRRNPLDGLPADVQMGRQIDFGLNSHLLEALAITAATSRPAKRFC